VGGKSEGAEAEGAESGGTEAGVSGAAGAAGRWLLSARAIQAISDERIASSTDI